MKEIEEGDDVVVGGTFKTPQDGWHKCAFKTGIDFLPAGKDKEGNAKPGFWQDENGNKVLKLPCVVADDEDPDDGGQVNIVLNTGNQAKTMTGILKATGLWDAVKKRFPDPNVSVFDPPVVEGIKLKLPERTCMIKTKVIKERCTYNIICSFAKYKEILAEEKKKGGSAAASGSSAKEPPKPSEPAGDDWG